MYCDKGKNISLVMLYHFNMKKNRYLPKLPNNINFHFEGTVDYIKYNPDIKFNIKSKFNITLFFEDEEFLIDKVNYNLYMNYCKNKTMKSARK